MYPLTKDPKTCGYTHKQGQILCLMNSQAQCPLHRQVAKYQGCCRGPPRTFLLASHLNMKESRLVWILGVFLKVR